MKTLTKSVIASLFTAVLLSTSAMATFAATPIQKTTAYAGFNKIWVSGNVKIVLTQGDKEEVQVGDNFNSENTTIQSQGQTLYINSMESAQVTINVSVKDLQRIEAAGSSVVVTSNNFDVKYLQVFLSQSATAKIKTTAGSLYTVVND
ncbi:GIN domain-containing protein, partial [Pedobacter metabolipauper]